MPDWWNSIEALSRLSSKLQVASGVLLLLTVVATLLTLRLSNRLEHLRVEQHRQLLDRIQVAESALAHAEQQVAARAADVPPKPAESQKAPTAASPAPAVVERPVSQHTPKAARRLTEEQRREFIAFMKDKPRGRIGVLTVSGDGEAHGFALKIERMLREAGLETEGVAQAVFPRQVPRGLLLRLRGPDSAPPQAAFLQLALERIGLPTPGISSSQEPANSVTLVVGRNPDT